MTISNITGDGGLGISIAAGTAYDLAGNLAPAAGPSTAFTVDNTAPTISLGGPSQSYTTGRPVSYTVTYADANFNAATLAAGNVTLNETGTANGTVTVSGTGTTRTVTISNITGDGSLGVSMVAGTASDLAGNLAPAAGPSATFTVDVTPPSVATPASATPNSVTATTTALSVLGADSLGESSLTYTWAATALPSGAAAPTFSANGTNAAKNTTAAFSAAGSYTFQVTIADPDGLTATSTVVVAVNQTLTGVAVSPAVANLTPAGTQQFSAAVVNQFGNAMSSQPAWTWSLIGAGSISSNGLYLPPYATGSATVQVYPLAGGGSLTGTATVNFAGAAVWSSPVNSSWNTPGNWRDSITGAVIAAPGLRGIAGDTVVFNSSAGGAVTLDGADPILAGITFSGSSQTIAQGSGGTLSLNNSGGTASITVGGGAPGNPGPTISAPLTLNSNTGLVVTPAAGGSLTLSGAVSGTGAGLILNGPGTLVLSGVDTNVGTASISSGTLAVNPGAVATFALVNISSGGADLNGGTIAAGTFSGLPMTFNLGTLEYTGNLTVSANDWLQDTLGAGHPIGFAQQLTVDGTTTLNAPLALAGGTFSTASLANPSLLTFAAGTFDLTSDNLDINGAPGTPGHGLFGSGLALSSGMTVNVTNNATIAADASLSMQGGTFSAATLTNSGSIGGSGRINAPLTNASDGLVSAPAGDQLLFTAASNVNQGQIELSGGAVNFTGALTNGALPGSSGLITGNGHLIVSGGLLNSGTMTLSAVTNIDGTVTNAAGGLIDAGYPPAGGGTTTFWNNVVNNGTIRTENGTFSVFYGAVSGSGAFTGPGTTSFESNLAITTNGSQETMDAPVVLAGNLVVNGSGTLDFGSSSSIGETGGSGSVTMSGAGGTLILSGTDSYTGGTKVEAGTLYVTSPSALAAGSSLIIGAGGTFVFDPTFAAASSDTTTASNNAAAIAPAAKSNQAPATTAAPVAADAASTSPALLSPPAVASISVTAEDSFGSVNTAFDGNVTISNPSGGIPVRTRTVAAVNGVATFSGLSIDQAHGGNALVASAPGLDPATSGPFSVSPSAATQLDSLGPLGQVLPGSAFAMTVLAEDPYGNVDPTFAGDVTLALGANPGGGALGGTGAVGLAVSNVRGAIAGLNLPDSGTGSLTISGMPLAAGTETCTVTVTATDSEGEQTSTNYTITVNPAVPPGNLGIFSAGYWYRDMDGTHQWDAANQAAVAYFG